MDNPKKKWIMPAMGLVILLAGFGDVCAVGGKKDKKEKHEKKVKKEKKGLWDKTKELFSGSSGDDDTPQAEQQQEPQDYVEGYNPEIQQQELAEQNEGNSDSSSSYSYSGGDGGNDQEVLLEQNPKGFNLDNLGDHQSSSDDHGDPPALLEDGVNLPKQLPKVPQYKPVPPNYPPPQRPAQYPVPGENQDNIFRPDGNNLGQQPIGNGGQPTRNPQITSAPSRGLGTWLGVAVVVTIVSYISWRKFFAKKPKQKPHPKPNSKPSRSQKMKNEEE